MQEEGGCVESTNVNVMSGFVSRGAVLSTAQNGVRFLTFGFCWILRKKDENGTWVDDFNFIDCILFGRMAMADFKNLRKGQRITIKGKLKQNSLATAPSRGFQILVEEIDYGSMLKKYRQAGDPR